MTHVTLERKQNRPYSFFVKEYNGGKYSDSDRISLSAVVSADFNTPIFVQLEGNVFVER
jgi:hypothetical protein